MSVIPLGHPPIADLPAPAPSPARPRKAARHYLSRIPAARVARVAQADVPHIAAHPRPDPRPRPRPRVALIVETAQAPGREILQGIARYLRAHGPWSTLVEPRSLDELAPGWLENWDGQGIIARVQSPRIAAAIEAAGIPAVDVLGAVRDACLPRVHADDGRVSLLAAEHLLERGFRHFAFLGFSGEAWSQRRRDAFHRIVAPRARSWHVYETLRTGPTGREDPAREELARWIETLPRPTGLMLCSDECGPAVLEACRRAGVVVPDDVAVIGVDDDEPLCAVAEPGLSSVRPDHQQVGYGAAALLDRLMQGGPGGEQRPILVPPSGVVTRRSSDVLALDDREVAAAVRMIRERACDAAGLTIDDLAAEVSVSRSVLQRRFQRAIGRTLHDEMLRVRLARARELLSETDLPIAAVAGKAGFRHQEYMGAVFRQKLDITPAQFRRAHQRASVVGSTW